MKALFVYSGARKDKFRGIPGRDFPDTQFYGQNHLKYSGIEADYKERDDAIPKWIEKAGLGKLFGFRLRHLFMYFLTRRYDVVFGSSLLYMMFLKKFIPTRAKYILLNIGLTRTLRANQKRPLRRRLIVWLLNELDGIVCLSNVQKEWVAARLPNFKGKISFVPLGVDIDFYQPVFEGRSDLVISVGRDNGRDYKTLVEAARRLTDTSFEIICSRRNMARIEDIPKNVAVIYDAPFDEVYKKYQQAGLMVLSTHDDSFADGSDCSGQTVLLEAMACGLPIVATRKKYLEDYTREGEDIAVAESGDAESLTKSIRALQNRELRLRLAHSARKRAEALFSTKTMAARLADVFKSL